MLRETSGMSSRFFCIINWTVPFNETGTLEEKHMRAVGWNHEVPLDMM